MRMRNSIFTWFIPKKSIEDVTEMAKLFRMGAIAPRYFIRYMCNVELIGSYEDRSTMLSVNQEIHFRYGKVRLRDIVFGFLRGRKVCRHEYNLISDHLKQITYCSDCYAVIQINPQRVHN